MKENTSPAADLAARITKRLIRDGLLIEGRGERFMAALAAGKLKSSDWRLALEEEPNAQNTAE